MLGKKQILAAAIVSCIADMIVKAHAIAVEQDDGKRKMLQDVFANGGILLKDKIVEAIQ